MTTVKFSTTINAPVKTVWHTMLDDATYREWTLEFNAAGSWFEGSWEEGSAMKFMGPDPVTGKIGGMNSEIAVNRYLEYISIHHLGTITDGQATTATPEAPAWEDGYENYTFTDLGNQTTKLDVSLDLPDEWATMFDEMWPKALAKLKAMCESSS